MSWRTIVITRHCKLDLKLNCMVVRSENETQRIVIDEISTLILETTAISITACLLAELAAKKVKVIFCDEKRNPCSELVPYYGSHDCSRKIEQQISWNASFAEVVWSEIIADKIRKQAAHLAETGAEDKAGMLLQYVTQIEPPDKTNREGHAAKVYFNALFGNGFSRTDDSVTNAALNYGYSILLSAFNREIVACGYLTQLGLFHRNMFNQFNLSCDLMEPFRVLIDRIVKSSDFKEFDKNAKMTLVDVLNSSVAIDGTRQYVNNAIKIYCRSVFEALNENDISLIKFLN